jgi:TonB family protein
VRRYAPAGRLRMFEESTLQQGRRRRSLWPLAVSVALHAGAIAALGFAAARAPALGAGERPIDVVFLREAIQDAAAPPAASASPEERRAARERQAMLDRLVQPTVVADDASSGTAAGAGAQDGAAPGDADLPVDAGGGVVPPMLIESSKVQPVYPGEAPSAGELVQVLLELSIDERGKVVGVKVVRGLGPGCDAALEALVAAVRHWRFRPATRYGKPIEVRSMMPLLSPPCS